jgi:hypothetical protein
VSNKPVPINQFIKVITEKSESSAVPQQAVSSWASLSPATSAASSPAATAVPEARPVNSVKIHIQTPGGPVMRLGFAAAMLDASGSRIILIDHAANESYLKLPDRHDSQDSVQLGVRLPNDVDYLVDLRSAFEFEYAGYRFLTFEISQHAEAEVPIEAESNVFVPPDESFPLHDNEVVLEYNPPLSPTRGALDNV